MTSLITCHAADIITSVILIILVFAAVRKIVRDRRAGKTSCGCSTGCAGCMSRTGCSTQKNMQCPADRGKR